MANLSLISSALGEIMPIRFRKIFSLGKGFRINLSKRGMSASIGNPGGTLNIGKRGVRPTVGLPGTGISFTPTQNNTSKNNSKFSRGVVLSFSILSTCLFVICCFAALVSRSGSSSATATPAAQVDPAFIIASTSSAAQTQTSIAIPPTSIITSTILPSSNISPTSTVFIFSIQTDLALTNQYIYSTNTPFTLATPTLSSSGAGVCSCTIDLDCKDFSTHRQAQSCYDYCVSLGYGDVHNIDGNDKDGLACESLP